jgi:carbon monoxide dehydrogenase subunit G
MKVERKVDIAAPPEEVYDLIADPDRLQDWVTIHDSLVEPPGEQLSKGSKMTQCLRLAGQRFKVRWEVVESDRPHSLIWEGRGPVRSHAKVENRLEPSDAGTCFSYTNVFDLPGGPLGKMAGPMVRRVAAGELEKSLARLRQLVE